MAALQSHAASRLAGLRVDDGPAAGPDHASLADVVLRGVETFPPYRESFYAASIASAVRAPDFIEIVQAARGAEKRRASAEAATREAVRAFAAGAAAMGASREASDLVARSLASRDANVRALVAAGAAALEATQGVLRATARRAGLHDEAAAVVASRMLDGDVRQVVSVARAARCGAPPTARAGSGDHARIVYVSLPEAAGPQRWRAGLYEEAAPAGDADVVYRRIVESPGEQLGAYLFRVAIAGKGTLWFLGSSVSKTSAGASSDYDAADRPDDIAAPWFVYDGAQWFESPGLKITAMPPNVAAALARSRRKNAKLMSPR